MSLPTRKILIVDDSPEDREMKMGAQDDLVKNRLNPEALRRALDTAVYKADPDRLLAGERAALESTPAEAVSWSVLIVEDHADSARVLMLLMRRRGYRAFHAGSVAEAVALYQSEPVDLVVSDLGLPDGNGVELIRRLQAIRPVPSIVLSGHGEADALADSEEAGVREHLIKPVEWSRLEAAIQRVLRP